MALPTLWPALHLTAVEGSEGSTTLLEGDESVLIKQLEQERCSWIHCMSSDILCGLCLVITKDASRGNMDALARVIPMNCVHFAAIIASWTLHTWQQIGLQLCRIS